MNSIILDCSYGMSICVLNGNKEFSYIDNNEKKHSDELLVVLDDLLKKADLKITDVQNICVCIGPGSFTGVRVAISVCKGLAIGAGAKVFVLSNLDIFDVENKEKSVLVLDGFSDFVYVRVFENGKYSDKCLSCFELKNMVRNEGYEVFAYQEKVQNKLKNIEIMSKNCEINAKNAFLEKIKNNEFVDLNKIEPVYLRASQAEIERNKKLAGEK